LFAWAVLLAICAVVESAGVVLADKDKGQQISRVIAKEMTAAQKAMQASQWAGALKNWMRPRQKSPLTPFDKKTIYDFKGFANIKLNNQGGRG
jgi:hypothetical protein